MRLALPFEDEPHSRAPLGSHEPNKKRLRLGGVPVLVVEDDPAGGRFLSTLLASEGASVRLCHDGREALQLVQAFRPRLAVIDLALPGMSGLLVLDELRRQPGCEQLAGIAVSALNGPRIEQLVDRSGFAGFVRKPIEMERLIRLAVELLEGRS
jgi:CheY-like chemotaxis protein